MPSLAAKLLGRRARDFRLWISEKKPGDSSSNLLRAINLFF